MLRTVELAMHEDALVIDRARARVAAAIGNPLALGDEAVWEVDLELASFASRREGRVVFAGPCQLVALQPSAAVWIWGFDEPSVPKSASRDVRAQVRGDAILFEASLASPLAVPEPGFALRLATWIAIRGGFAGACAAPLKGRVGLFAVGPTARDGRTPNDRWCLSCGSAGPFFVRNDVALCSACANDLRELGEPHPLDPRKVVFEGTLRTPEDLVTLRAAFGSTTNLALTTPGFDDAPRNLARSSCLSCGRARGDLLVLNDAFTLCPLCAEAYANALEYR